MEQFGLCTTIENVIEPASLTAIRRERFLKPFLSNNYVSKTIAKD